MFAFVTVCVCAVCLSTCVHVCLSLYNMCTCVLKGHTCSCSSSVQSLAVETALGSFDFLNTSDLEDEDEEEDGEKRSVTDRSGSIKWPPSLCSFTVSFKDEKFCW